MQKCGKTVTPAFDRDGLTVSFRDGRGEATVCDAGAGLRRKDVKSITADIHFIGVDTVGVPPHSVEFYETVWGNPVTTQEMIDFVAARGFNIIRPQISWINHIDKDGNVDPAWMDRVAEVVDYHMNAGVYCLINTTGAGWLTTEPDRFEENRALYQKLWAQIAARFKDYGELLIFESMNEVFYTEYLEDFPNEESSRIINELNQLFVDTVRAQGGYNATRNLCVNTYGTMAYYDVTRNFIPPEDSTQGHLLAQVHNYTGAAFKEKCSTRCSATWNRKKDRNCICPRATVTIPLFSPTAFCAASRRGSPWYSRHSGPSSPICLIRSAAYSPDPVLIGL